MEIAEIKEKVKIENGKWGSKIWDSDRVSLFWQIKILEPICVASLWLVFFALGSVWKSWDH